MRRQRRSRTDAIPRIRLELYFVVEHKSRHMLLHRASDSPRVPVMLRSGGTFLFSSPCCDEFKSSDSVPIRCGTCSTDLLVSRHCADSYACVHPYACTYGAIV